MSIRIAQGSLTHHAHALDGFAADLDVQAGKTASVGLSDGCFGMLNAWMPSRFEKCIGESAEAVREKADLLTRVAEALRVAEQDLFVTDDLVAFSLRLGGCVA